MTDWETIATVTVGILAPFIKKVSDKAATAAGEAIFKLLKRGFKGDKEAENMLKNFKHKPDRYTSALADIVKEKAMKDKAFGEALEALLLEGNRIKGDIVSQMAKGENIAQANGNNARASVSIKK